MMNGNFDFQGRYFFFCNDFFVKKKYLLGPFNFRRQFCPKIKTSDFFEVNVALLSICREKATWSLHIA